jgi:hypothetical protein
MIVSFFLFSFFLSNIKKISIIATKLHFMNDKKWLDVYASRLFLFQAEILLVLMYSFGVMSVATHKWVSGCKVCNKSSSKLLLR